jgi:hypothetical protein
MAPLLVAAAGIHLATGGDIPGKGKATKIAPPKPVAPPAIETADQAGEQVRKRKPSGRQATFITGDLVPETKKKTTLG